MAAQRVGCVALADAHSHFFSARSGAPPKDTELALTWLRRGLDAVGRDREAHRLLEDRIASLKKRAS